MPLTIRRTSYTSTKGEMVEWLGAFMESGDLIGLISPDNDGQLAEDQQTTIHHGLAVDGNVRLV